MTMPHPNEKCPWCDYCDKWKESANELAKALEDIERHAQPPFGDIEGSWEKWRFYMRDIASSALAKWKESQWK